MIKRVLLLFIILIGSMLFGLHLMTESGYVSIEYSGWNIGFPVWFGMLTIIISFILFYWTIRTIAFFASLSSRWRNWRAQVRERHAHSLSTQGLIAFNEGDWAFAEKQLTRAVLEGENPLVNYLAAAKAAQEQGATSRRDTYLQRAQKAMPDAKVAVGLSQAELQIASGQIEQALASLRHLHAIVPNHSHVLKLLQQLLVQCHEWPSLVDLLPKLRQRRVLSNEEYRNLEIIAYCGLIETCSHLRELTFLEKTWNNLPRKLRKIPELVAVYTQCLMEHNAQDQAASILYSALYYQLDDELLQLYGMAQSDDPAKQLARAERWLPKNPNHPALLLCLGRLCIRNQLWGKARTYLENSIALRPSAESYATLAKLCDRLGEGEQAGKYYRKGLEATLVPPQALQRENSDTV